MSVTPPLQRVPSRDRNQRLPKGLQRHHFNCVDYVMEHGQITTQFSNTALRTMDEAEAGVRMTSIWKQLGGQLINGEYRLKHPLGTSDHSAVFLTELLGRETSKAVIKLFPLASSSEQCLFSSAREV